MPTFYLGAEFAGISARLLCKAEDSLQQSAMSLNLDQIRTAAQRVASSHGLDVVDVEYRAGARPRALCVYIEKNAEERTRLAARSEGVPEGVAAEQLSGVTHEDCTAFSRDFGTLLDVEDLIPGAEYTLEVSSPGLDRKLRTQADFERFTGSLVKVQTFEPVAGNRHWQGRLTQVDAQTIRLDPSALRQKGSRKKAAKAGQEKSQEQVEIAFGNVEKASLIPEF